MKRNFSFLPFINLFLKLITLYHIPWMDVECERCFSEQKSTKTLQINGERNINLLQLNINYHQIKKMELFIHSSTHSNMLYLANKTKNSR